VAWASISPRPPWRPALGQSIDVLAVKLDVTSRADAEAAVRAAVDRFGRIDVLVNNAASFDITTTVVNPGFFRTELLTEQSTNYAAPSIEDYDAGRARQLEFWKAQNGKQSGDPAKLARALIIIASQEPPPRRFIADADAIATAEQTVADLTAQIDAERDLSTSLAFD